MGAHRAPSTRARARVNSLVSVIAAGLAVVLTVGAGVAVDSIRDQSQAARADLPAPPAPDDRRRATTDVDAPLVAPTPVLRAFTPQELAAAAEVERLRQAAARKARLATPFSFTYSTFNILGSNHTAPGSDADEYAPGRIRTEWAVDAINAHRVDIVGFSEIQRDQLTRFLATTRGSYDVWPGEALGGGGVPTTLAWRKDRFTAVTKTSITIPFVGQQRPQPVVRLREKATGREFWVINAHNSPNDMQAERDAAMRIEIAKIKELRTTTKLPVFFGGDLNEKANALCKVTSQTDLVAASPSGNWDSCTGWSGMRIDWIFGSNVTFSGYVADRSPLITRITDHAMIVARATVS